MTELEAARTHLKEAQSDLSFHRSGYAYRPAVAWHEQCVLAALSRVWDAQQRENAKLWSSPNMFRDWSAWY